MRTKSLRFMGFMALAMTAGLTSMSSGQERQPKSIGNGNVKATIANAATSREDSPVHRTIRRSQRPGMLPSAPKTPVVSASFQSESLPHEEYLEEETSYAHEMASPSTEHFQSDAIGQCCRGKNAEGMLWRLAPGRAGKWLNGDYLFWGVSGAELPPLVTSSPVGTAPAATGILGQPTTQVLFGNDSETMASSGFRISGGWWLDCSNAAIEIVYAGLPSFQQRSTFTSGQFPLLARPVFDTLTSSEAAMLISHPSQMLGNISVHSSTEFHQVDLLRRVRQYQDNCTRFDTVIGLRVASLEESLRIDQSSTYTTGVGQIIGGTRVDLFDQFATRNQFVGFVIGGELNRRFGHWSLDVRGLISLGNNRAEVHVAGQTITSVPNAGSATFEGGLLAQQTNIGRDSRDRFTCIPEFYVGGRTQIDRCWEASAGYAFMYWSDAVQPGNQIDRRVSQFPPENVAGPSPRALFNTNGIVIHGLQAGLTFKF